MNPRPPWTLPIRCGVMDLMEKLKAEKGITVVMVSHDINPGIHVRRTAAVIKRGKNGDGRPPE